MSEITSYDQARDAITNVRTLILRTESVFTNDEILKRASEIKEIFRNLKEVEIFLTHCEQREIQLERRCND